MSPELMNRVCQVRPARLCVRRRIVQLALRCQHRSMSVKRGLSFCLRLYPAAVRTRMQLPFEVLHLAFKLIDALSEREHVVAGRVVHAFQRFGEPGNLGPKPL